MLQVLGFLDFIKSYVGRRLESTWSRTGDVSCVLHGEKASQGRDRGRQRRMRPPSNESMQAPSASAPHPTSPCPCGGAAPGAQQLPPGSRRGCPLMQRAG